jgi:hypothetical protein
MLTHADGTAERDAALLMLHRQWRKRRRRGQYGAMSVGADKAYDTQDFVQTARAMNTRPHGGTEREPARRQRGRRTHRATRELSTEPTKTTTDRKGFWMDEADRRNAQNQAARLTQSGLAVRHDFRRIQLTTASEIAPGHRVTQCRKKVFFNTKTPKSHHLTPFLIPACNRTDRRNTVQQSFFNKFLELHRIRVEKNARRRGASGCSP